MTSKTTHTTNLRVLDPINVDKDDFEYFADTLGLWASQYIPEIALPIAMHAEALFEVQAVRILLAEWHEAYKLDRHHQREAFLEVAVDKTEGITPKYFDSCYKSTLHAYSQALYALIVE